MVKKKLVANSSERVKSWDSRQSRRTWQVWVIYPGHSFIQLLLKQLGLGARFSKRPGIFRVPSQILESDLLNSSTVPGSQTNQSDQFCFLIWQFHCLIFKIIETFFLNANRSLNRFPSPKSYWPGLETASPTIRPSLTGRFGWVISFGQELFAPNLWW